MNKQFVLGVVAVVALLVSVLALTNVSGLRSELTAAFGDLKTKVSDSLGAAGVGPTHYQTENFLQGLYAGTVGQFYVDRSGNVSSSQLTAATVSFTGEVTLGSCSTKSYTLPIIPAGEATSTSITDLTGATNGDMAIASWLPQSATGTLQTNKIALTAEVTTGTTAFAWFLNTSTSSASTAIATSTLKICYFD